MQDDFAQLTKQAEALVQSETGLVAAGAARVRVPDRPEWAKFNIATLRRLLGPTLKKLEPKSGGGRIAAAGRLATGTQLGLILGWMSTRVLGQYDMMLADDDHPEEQDLLYYVRPNIIAIEKRYGFAPRQFRLWIALHECTHRAQFTGVSWLPGHFKSLVTSVLESVDTDPQRFARSLRRALDERKEPKTRSSTGGGMISAFASPEQRAAIAKITGLMALLEGHGEITMYRAGRELIPDAERFHRVLHERRKAHGFQGILQRLLGIEAKLKQYSDGKAFVTTVEDAGGPELFAKVWERPENLPDHAEIRQPKLWLDRLTG